MAYNHVAQRGEKVYLVAVISVFKRLQDRPPQIEIEARELCVEDVNKSGTTETIIIVIN